LPPPSWLSALAHCCMTSLVALSDEISDRGSSGRSNTDVS